MITYQVKELCKKMEAVHSSIKRTQYAHHKYMEI
jgi:hypothetical protein